MRPILKVARTLFAGLGVIAILIDAGAITGGLTPGAHIDWIVVTATLALGLGALAGAAWVLAPDTTRAALAWAGIAVVVIASLLPTYSLFPLRHGTDVVAIAVIVTLTGLLTSAVMARARWVGGHG